MTKINLPVILLRGIVLLPHSILKLEFDNGINNSILDIAHEFHNDEVLVISPTDILEEIITKDTLPNIGVVAKIGNRIELPNGNVRLDVKGLRRVQIVEYLNIAAQDEILESIVTEILKTEIQDEQVLIRKLIKELEICIKTIPYFSNSILSLIRESKTLNKLTDLTATHLVSQPEKRMEYLLALDPSIRFEMLLEDLYKEKQMFQIDRNLDLKVKKEIDSTQKEFLLREKIKLIKEELGDSSAKETEVDELRNRIASLECNDKIKTRLETELRRFENSVSTSPEVNILRTYMEWLLELPWEIETEDNKNLKKVREELDKTHYGLDSVKDRIVEYLAVKQKTNSLRGPILCLVGPPGVGKTSLAYSIANSIGRNFVKISVGGVNDEAEIMGHRRTYVGANPGRIISSMKKAKSNNPVFLIDEVDKMTKDYKGDPASALLEILDPEQNKYFSDNYIEEEFDLSNVMFVLTANYIDDIPIPLKDRLEIIDLTGYTEYEKLDIAKKHLLPKICLEHGIDVNFVEFKDEIILEIIRNYTKEAGVRELERKLTTIIRKIVTQIVVNKIKANKVNIDNKALEKYLGNKKFQYNKINSKKQIGVVNGLAYTIYGGDTLPIEVNYYQGTGKLVLTGSLGEVMKESASIALSYIKANSKDFKIDVKKLKENDIHVHVPEGAIKKDGPSAGVAVTLALVSALTNKKIPNDIALTGEITLRGNILPVGGLKEKSVGALRSGVKKIFIPVDNNSDLNEIPDEVKESIEFIQIKDFKEVLNMLGGK